MPETVRLAVFDLDGTLVDSLGHISRAVVETAQTVGVPAPPPEMIPRVIGLSLDKALATLFPAASAEHLDELHRIYRETFSRWRALPHQTEPLFDGVGEMLAAFAARGFVLGIATGKSRRGVDRLLDAHGLHGHFATIQTADTSPSKPHPDMLLKAMAETGADPAQTAMIGDTVYDINMALAAQTHAVGVHWGNHPVNELQASGAHVLVERMAQLLQAVERLVPVSQPLEDLRP